MPTYIVTTCSAGLTEEARQAVATEITEAHHAATGAQRFFVQVIFRDVSASEFYIGGKPAISGSFFIHGHIRAGRTVERKQDLMTRICQSVAQAASTPARNVWVYISDIPAEQVIEFGHILPQPGQEAAWLGGLPDEDQRYIATVAE